MRAAVLRLALAAAASPAVVEAAAPAVEYLYPAGGQRGTNVTVSVGGKFDPWPVQAWTDSADVRFEAGKESGSFTVHIGKSAAVGPHLVRLYNGEGASALRVFMVGEQREVAETEPNDQVVKAQSVDALPLTINGQLEKSGDVDAYGVNLEAGQCLVASLQGRRLGAPMDPMLHLFDEAGNELAFAHDGLGLDPLLVYRAAAGGRFVVRVSGFAHPPAADVKLTGAKSNVYRLNLTTGSFVRWARPAAVKRGEKRSIALDGWNLSRDGAALTIDADATAARATQDHLSAPAPGTEAPLRIALSDGAELVEGEGESAAILSPPFGVTGRIARAREEDRYRFTAKKGDKLVLSVRGAWVESAFDAVLTVENESGKELARDDDGAGSGDPRLEFTCPQDGTYKAVVADLNRQGGEGFDYHFSARRAAPGVTAAVAAHEVRLGAGKSATVKMNVGRVHGRAGELVALAAGLPAGVTSGSAIVPAKGGEVEVTLSAAADAKAASQPIRLMVVGTDPEQPFARAAVYDLSKEAGQSFVESTDSVWLTVVPPPPATQPATKPAAAPKK